MSRTRTPRIVSSLALGAGLAVAVAASSAFAKDPEVLRLRAFAVDLNSGARTNTLDIVIERWSTPEEASEPQGRVRGRGRRQAALGASRR